MPKGNLVFFWILSSTYFHNYIRQMKEEKKKQIIDFDLVATKHSSFSSLLLNCNCFYLFICLVLKKKNWERFIQLEIPETLIQDSFFSFFMKKLSNFFLLKWFFVHVIEEPCAT